MKDAQVHLVATDKPSPLTIVYEQLVYTPTRYWDKLRDRNPQHLYFTDDSEIKEGDKGQFLSIVSGEIYTECVKITNVHNAEHKNGVFNNDKSSIAGSLKQFRKIVATDNKELWYDKHGWQSSNLDYPKPIPTSFISTYIKSYNDGKPILKVKLEEQIAQTIKQSDYKYYGDHQSNLNYIPTLKLTPDGAVIVVPVEERMYTREDMKAAYKEALIAGLAGRDNISGDYNTFDKWFDKTYPK